ncbi:glycoside hydrolase family 1 protein [Novosphingobium sp. Chol11]|uniref:glycoside hydrolase family 1 protein n=1 Tax=Novosphingobium sp. Chol11 TaxID=1385763 RepID=UPI000BE2A81C|nr:family 1 glycosylhydrolase [Novosphingobium sp. Chol11]
MSQRRKPGFLWGAATAAHQVEGNNINSDIWLLEALPGTPFKERSGDACDHFSRYDDDIALLAKLGLNTYRFSIEWARVEPDEGLFSAAMLAHYGRVLDSCRRHGVVPMVTLHHFTSPRWFAAKGGFENPEAPGLFARYARRVVEAVGDRIDWLCTINEANLTFAPVPSLLKAAAQATGSDTFSTFLFSNLSKSKPIVRDCHAAARAAIKDVRRDLPVGYTLAIDDIQDAPGVSGRAARLNSALYDVWLTAAREDDFIGVQNYSRKVLGDRGFVMPQTGALGPEGKDFYPASLGGAVRYAASVAKVPVVVTENGIGTADDTIRVRHMDGALASLRNAIKDGVEVRGYIHWSFLDNFEWLSGYGEQFGLVAVDRASQQRIVKPSARYLGKVARAGSY